MFSASWLLRLRLLTFFVRLWRDEKLHLFLICIFSHTKYIYQLDLTPSLLLQASDQVLPNVIFFTSQTPIFFPIAKPTTHKHAHTHTLEKQTSHALNSPHALNSHMDTIQHTTTLPPTPPPDQSWSFPNRTDPIYKPQLILRHRLSRF